MWGSKIVRISIVKPIHRDTKIKIQNQLKNINKHKTKALFLDISSQACSLNQAIEISNLFKLFKKENPCIPLYTFAEDQVFGPGIAILTSGDHVFANQNSLFGCYDFIKKGNEYKGYLNEKKININFHTAGENKFLLNPFEELKDNEVTWFNNILSGLKNVLIDYVYENRRHKLRNKETFSRIFNSSIYYADEAIENNLIDSVGMIDTIAMETFPNVAFKKAKTKVTLKQILNHYKNSTLSHCNYINKASNRI